jgi:hypothetical protein
MESLNEKYIKAANDCRLASFREEKKLLILSLLRLVSFAAGILIIWIGFTRSNTAGLIVSLPVIILFLYLLKLYSSHSCKKEFLLNLSRINERESSALSGDFSSFEAGAEFVNPDHTFSFDVDLFGNSSLFQYLNRTITSYGREILAGWLSDPYSLNADLAKRQEAVRELAGKEKWRHTFMASGYNNPLEKNEIAALIDWISEHDDSGKSGLKTILIFIFPSAAIISLSLLISGILHYSVFTFIFLVNLLIITAGLKKTNRIHNALSKKYYYLSSMDNLLKAFGSETFNSEILNEIQKNISVGKVSAAGSVRKLGSLIQAFDSRLNLLVGFALNGLLLWDYHSIRRLEKWKTDYSIHFPVWLMMLGEVDAYISLGNYAFNNPHFSYPSLSTGKIMLSATSLGHPLINETDRVCNDFSIPDKGVVCVITGANMAGKSTFLRTLAVNYIVGMAGAPVCAEEMSFTPVKLFTSMRTTDSLSNHESYFYAELKRLRQLKSLIENGEPVLFILDEILKGTNSADKSLGSKLFIQRLIELGGTGLIATHDISVGEMETDYRGRVINRCFEVEIDGENISFDYLLRDGITHKMNAALLMKQMGILS